MEPRTIAIAIGALLLSACQAVETPPPSSAQSSAEEASPSASVGLEPAPSFINLGAMEVPPGDPYKLEVADLNEDGNMDVVTTNYAATGKGVVVLLGSGDGSFEPAPDIVSGPTNFVRAADLNADGHLDLVAARDRLVVLIGSGDGTFEPAIFYDAGSGDAASEFGHWVDGLDVADLSGDAIPDLIAVNYPTSLLAVLLGRGDGTFDAPAFHECRSCTAVAAADFDADGDIDVVATGFKPVVFPGMLNVFMNDGAGSLADPVSSPHGGSVTIALGDLNRDGATDVVTCNDAHFTHSVLLGNGDGTFAEAQNYEAGNCHAVAVVDLDNDGALDVVSGSYEDPKVWFWHSTGEGGFVETQGIDTFPDVALGLAAADFNNDGALDLAISAGGVHGVVSILLRLPA